MTRVLVTGGRGQLARALAATWHDAELMLLGKDALDLGSQGDAEAAILAHRPEIVVNAGALTAVDACESMRERANLINGHGVGLLARACTKHGALLVHISTDYVFDGEGQTPLREGDPTRPATVYGQSKLLGEREARCATEHIILRTAWLFGGGGRDFRATMLRLAREGKRLFVVDDQRGSPTSVLALARQIRASVERGQRGLYHATCAGEASWFDLAKAIFEHAGMTPDLVPVKMAETARRPRHTVLDNALRLGSGKDVMGHFRDALAELPRSP